MPSQADKYLEYARECIRLAGYAVEVSERDKLVELARTWMQAAMTEEEAAAALSAKASSSKASSAKASPTRPSRSDPHPRV